VRAVWGVKGVMVWVRTGCTAIWSSTASSLPYTYVIRTNRMDSTTCFDHPTVQHSETNVMHFLFNLLRIESLYMIRALLAHPQEALHKALGILVYICMHIYIYRYTYRISFKFRCKILISGKVIKEQPGFVSSGTPSAELYMK
jgi:hypothetical protein